MSTITFTFNSTSITGKKEVLAQIYLIISTYNMGTEIWLCVNLNVVNLLFCLFAQIYFVYNGFSTNNS